MKIYQCDCCEKTIKDPYKEKMKEFYIDCHYECVGRYPLAFENYSKRKVKLHLCDECFCGLHYLAESKSSAKE